MFVKLPLKYREPGETVRVNPAFVVVIEERALPDECLVITTVGSEPWIIALSPEACDRALSQRYTLRREGGVIVKQADSRGEGF